MRLLVACIVLAGCGRIDFDAFGVDAHRSLGAFYRRVSFAG
jgi:hypothetical protein